MLLSLIQSWSSSKTCFQLEGRLLNRKQLKKLEKNSIQNRFREVSNRFLPRTTPKMQLSTKCCLDKEILWDFPSYFIVYGANPMSFDIFRGIFEEKYIFSEISTDPKSQLSHFLGWKSLLRLATDSAEYSESSSDCKTGNSSRKNVTTFKINFYRYFRHVSRTCRCFQRSFSRLLHLIASNWVNGVDLNK